MYIKEIQKNVVKTSLLCYGNRKYRGFICASSVFPGTGDDEDDPEIANDQKKDCFAVWFEDFLQTGTVNACGGYFRSIEEAVESVERTSGFIGWLQTHGCVLELKEDGNYHYYYGTKENYTGWVEIVYGECVWNYRRMGGISISKDYDDLQTCIDEAYADMVKAKL